MRKKLERMRTIPAKEKKFVEDLLWNRPHDGFDAPEDYRQQSKEQRAAINQHHIAAINEHFRTAESRVKKKTSDFAARRSAGEITSSKARRKVSLPTSI